MQVASNLYPPSCNTGGKVPRMWEGLTLNHLFMAASTGSVGDARSAARAEPVGLVPYKTTRQVG